MHKFLGDEERRQQQQSEWVFWKVGERQHHKNRLVEIQCGIYNRQYQSNYYRNMEKVRESLTALVGAIHQNRKQNERNKEL